MTLPDASQFNSPTVTENQYKEAQAQLIDHIQTLAAKTEVVEAVTPKADKAYVDTALASFQNGAIKTYPTLSAANADIANIALNTKVSVLSETDGGDYYKATSDATSLTKSPYDPLQQSKNYVKDLIGSISLATLSDLTGSNYIRKSDGTRVASSYWKNSTFIPVLKDQEINLVAANTDTTVDGGTANIAFYDMSKNFISAYGVAASATEQAITVTAPSDGYIILATRTATSSVFSCSAINTLITSSDIDVKGGVISYDKFNDRFSNLLNETTSSGVGAFPVSGYVSASSPATYPTASTTAYNSGLIKINKGSVVKTTVAMSSVGYAIAFYSTQSSESFVAGVVGNNAAAVKEYTYTAPTDGYIVFSVTKGALINALELSSYTFLPELIGHSSIDQDYDSVTSLKNLNENDFKNAYYETVDVKAEATVLSNYYIGTNGSLVASTNHRIRSIHLLKGESLYVKTNLGGSTLSTIRGLPAISKYISEGVYEPLKYNFVSGNVYVEHIYTATEDCTLAVTSYLDGVLPVVIYKRKYLKDLAPTKYTYSVEGWQSELLHSASASGRKEANTSFMTTPLIPVKKGDVVVAKACINTSVAAGAATHIGMMYNRIGKYLGQFLQTGYINNSSYHYAASIIEQDGFIALNNYIATGLTQPELSIYSQYENEMFKIKGMASNPYGDIYCGLCYDATGLLVAAPAAVSYLFDKTLVPKDADVTISFAAGSSLFYLVKMDSAKAVISVTTLTAGINEMNLLDLFDSTTVAYVGVSHVSNGRDDSTSFSMIVEGRGIVQPLINLSDPIYKLYDLAGRPDKTLAYDYTPLLQSLCWKMSRQKRGKVYMESGLYKVSGCYIKSHNHIYGDGMYNTIIAGADVPFKNEKLSSNVYEKITITDLGFNLDLLSTRAGRGINMEYVKDLVVRNVWIYKSAITGFGVDMILSGVLDNIVTEGCGQNQQDGSCAGMGIGVGALLYGAEPIQVSNCINRNNFGHGIFFEWHNHRESSGETVIGDFPVGIQVTNCYSEGNAVGFGASGGNGVTFSNCTAYRNLNGFAADNGSQGGEVRYGKNTMFNGCKAIENGSTLNRNPYFTPRQMKFGNGNGFAIYKTANYSDAVIGDAARGYYLNDCISEDNEADGLTVTAATNVTTNIKEISINAGSYSRNKGHGLQFRKITENVIARGAMILNNEGNGIGIGAQLTDAIIKDNIIKGNAKGIAASSASYVDSSIIKDNIVKSNTVNLENVVNSL